ncbi:inositol polyphosphate kinase-domain-containing protein [Aspergillus pseudonomiae]|uniref:Kinase n=1 Tax=Aspergillus pseudonomiae TaxID=1506151 RepID=A0A5N7CZW9_9EURO|nr:inositol polyphosphate kinase-domain-containing protein [Aspergillus pseudonomiae]KAB8257320.1 inositol polyphosphate kinase-domain-containing protein [Aspergillus pseudonomiae]KAE8399710.1 inositol polyphosphate kinase-domain-containing protein [Aspergillus pseudonomiae]
MPSSSRSDSSKARKLDNDSFVAFDHAAAGHEGVRCTPSGSFIAKPCTPAEVAFYESCALHPAFAEFIPTYIGSLTSAEGQQQPLALASAQPGAIVLPSSDSSDVSTAVATPQPNGGANAPDAPATVEQNWVPSGGKKIDTGLSIVLENVACGFKRPNVLDVKLGARLWADDAPLAKRAKLDSVSKETTSSSLGFRIAGMKVWTGVNGENDEGGKTDPYATKYEGSEGAKGEVIEKDGYRRYDKWYGRAFSDKNVKEGFETFLAGAKAGSVDRSKLIARRLADELKNLQEVLESEESRMYSASVLIVYEGDPEAMEIALEEEKKVKENPKEDPEEEEEEDDESFELQLQQDGSFPVVDLPIQKDGLPQQAINISIDPETIQLGDSDIEEDEEEPPKVHDLRLIDFAHASWTPGQGPDENVLKGVRSLVTFLNELARE